MKYIFLVAFLVLGLASFGTSFFKKKIRSDKPVIYWVTDQNPARVRQVEAFQQWLKKKEYPEMELRLDAANAELSKKLIQGVSGVAGDIMDVYTDDIMPYLAEVGVIRDLSQVASRMNFSPEETYPALKAALEFRGRQYAVPCNVSVPLLVVNREAFRNVQMPPPPSTWDFETFERIGREYVERANANNQGERRFFCSPSLAENVLRRSYGLDVFNETLTRCILDDPRNIRMLEKLRQWTLVDRLIPSAGEQSSFSGESGGGNINTQLFLRGNYALLYIARHLIIQARMTGEPDLAVAQPPYAEFPNTLISARAAAIYSGGRHLELAEYFLKFLASLEYSKMIIEDGDGLPPLPAAALTPEFQQPAGHRNEWDFHRPFAEAAETIAIPSSVSPYVNPFLVKRLDKDYNDAFKANLFNAEESGRRAAQSINAEIARTLKEHPALQQDYESDCALQKQIEARKAVGQRIPASWIKNPFYLAYYRSKGLIEEDAR